MKRNILYILAIASCSICYSQPYLDIARINYTYSPKKGLNEKTNPLLSNDYNINLTLPIELKKGGDAFLINPFYDHNKGSVSGRSFHVISQGFGAGFLKKFDQDKWNLLSVFFFRRNKEAEKKFDYPSQYGGALVATWNKKPTLSLKLGLYYNREFFRNLFVPLAGINWKIDNRNNLFGLLPGSLTFEHKINKSFYWGANFRAITNAYRLETTDPCASGDCSGKNYLRVNDNQLGLFADAYITPNIVFTAEAGYTILRKYRFGFHGDILNNYSDFKNDNFYARLSLAYRLRFDR